MRFSFDTLIGRSNAGVLPVLLIKSHTEHSAKNAITSYVQEINLSLSALVNIAKYMKTLFEYKICPIRLKKASMLNKIPRKMDYQSKINVISCYSNLSVIHSENREKTLIILY